MDPLTEKQIRGSFVNCTKGEASRLRLPLDFGDLPWEDLDFLGWVDPGAPLRAHLVRTGPDGVPVGITLRVPASNGASALKSSICMVCLTGHASSDVALLSAPLAGARGREGNTVGIYLCADLACSLYLRGKRRSKRATGAYVETLSLEERIERALGNLDAFTAKVTGARVGA
ncbi:MULTISPECIES: FBP domain-containing protein [unclassified Streptomyces]|uniref:FBP domain-containing protein n=1 Tax=unclassified Streptomyces TaxID=2593676 RepID=UPI0022708242|nr:MULTISPECIES: FBP domain-containing protein [unclassified Streptomyces]MCY0916847.1 FBP domain-containing protein [Streptomyces sp. H27-G5]MCY0958005.1 FBP domain-containing protein [Streptomyces sp. H27-H5]